MSTTTRKSPRKTPQVRFDGDGASGGDGVFAFETTRISNRQSALMARRQSIKLDEGSFAAATYLPEHYLKSTMEADTEEAIQTALRSLGAARDKSVNELKRAVYKNHGEFLLVAEQLMDFDRMLEELRSLQNQIKTTATTLFGAAELSSFISFDEKTGIMTVEGAPTTVVTNTMESAKKLVATTESSHTPVINWEERAKKMSALAEIIGDFEQYLAPERYLIFEGGGITEQVGTSSPKPITLFLFNDAIAMASKKSRMVLSSSSKRLNLERFWLLKEAALSEVSDSKSIQNAFKLTRGGEYVLLQAETATGKRLWMQQIAKTQTALEHSGAASTTKSPTLTPATSSPRRGSPLLVPPERQQKHRRISSTASSRKEKILGKVDPEKIKELAIDLDELHSEIDQCDYEKAVEIIDKIKFELGQLDNQLPIVHQLGEKLRKLVLKAAECLYHEITDPIISREVMARFIQFLIVLGFADEARDKFLASRSEAIKDRLKHLRFTGDVAKTVNDIGYATFSSISDTADWYMSSFKDHPMTAGLKSSRLDYILTIRHLIKQIFSQDPNFKLIAECIGIARRQCSSLGRIGLDLNFYLEDQLLPHINRAIKQHQEITERDLAADLINDNFMEDKMELAQREYGSSGLSISYCLLQQRVVDFLNNLEPLLQGEVCELMVMRLSSMLENFVTGLVQASYNPTQPVVAKLNILANMDALVTDMLPSLEKQFKENFTRKFGDLTKLQARIQATITSLISIFSEGQAKNMVPSEMSCYENEGRFDGSNLSSWLATMLPLYAKISRDSRSTLRIQIMQALLSAILMSLHREISTTKKISWTGVNQVILDMHFLISASSRFLDDDLASKAAAFCAMALSKFKQHNPSSTNLEMPTEEWYQQQVEAISRRFPLDFDI